MFRKSDLFTLILILNTILIVSLTNLKYLYLFPLFIIAFFLSKVQKGKFISKVIELIPLIMFALMIMVSVDLFYLLVNTLLFSLLSKLLLPKNHIDYAEIFLVSLMIALVCSVSSISVSFGILSLNMFFLGSLTLIFSLFKNDKLAKTSNIIGLELRGLLISVLLTGIFFSFLPRLPLYTQGANLLISKNESGFSDKVEITDSEVELNNSIIMRVDTVKNEEPIYLSGLRFGSFDGKKWIKETSLEQVYPDYENIFGEKGEFNAIIYLEPTGTNVLFGLDRLIGIKSNFNLILKDSTGSFFTESIYYKTIKYEVYASNVNKVSSEKDLRKYLLVPNFSNEFISLANNLGKGQNEKESVDSIERYLKERCSYSLKPTASSIEDFVINKKSGYCEHFATAFVMMARISGVPARLVSGFVTDEWNANGNYYIARLKNAHTWAEAYIEGEWVRIDPTPQLIESNPNQLLQIIDSIKMSWYRNVITFDSGKQVELLRNTSDILRNVSRTLLNRFHDIKTYIIILPLPFFVFFFLNRKLKSKKENYNAIARMLILMIGNDKLPSETIYEFALRKKQLNLLGIINKYNEYRFGYKKVDGNQLAKEIKSCKMGVKNIT